MRFRAIFQTLVRSASLGMLLGSTALAGEADDPAIPAAVPFAVDFSTHVKPILESRCLACHGRGKLKGSFSIETRALILKGGEEGPAAVVGKGGESLLIELVAGLDEARKMPQKGEALSATEVGTLRAWIDQGMPWPEGFTFGFRQAPIVPRNPEIPNAAAGSHLENPIDRFIARTLGENAGTLSSPPVEDGLFLRRVSFDLVGLPPTASQRAAFAADDHPERRLRAIDRLLNDRKNYAEHWMTFWNDALRNAYRGTGFIDDGRKSITGWLYASLYENKPYDRFVHELVSPVKGSEGFTKGIIWRGVVNASQAPPVQAAQNVSQVFLGTNLKCASCHDSFVNHWKLTDAYALASVFADKPLELHRCDKPTGQTSAVGFVYPSLGEIDPTASKAARLDRLADLLVSPENGRFARTIVNRLWARLIGRGIVEPLDDMDKPAWDQDLLDWLASDFVAQGHDIKHTLALICSSKAYQLPSVGLPEPNERDAYVFRGPITRRLDAEQFLDAIASLTGAWPEPTPDMLKVDGRGQGGQVAAARAVLAAEGKPSEDKAGVGVKVEARWIWSHPDADKDEGGRYLFLKPFTLEKLPERAVLVGSCDNELVVHVNGQRAGRSDDWQKPASADVTAMLRPGQNVIAVEATNWPDPKNRRGTQHKGPNPAGLVVWLGGIVDSGLAWSIATDESWLWSQEMEAGWNRPGFGTEGWKHSETLPAADRLYAAVDLAAAIKRPEAIGAEGPLRSVFGFEDPLLTALNRANREQVVTRRDSVATTLQALELMNGTTLDRKLKQGARRWLDSHGRDRDGMVSAMFVSALGREPSAAERQAALELLGGSVTEEGAQDLLWTLVMLPEFQLIR